MLTRQETTIEILTQSQNTMLLQIFSSGGNRKITNLFIGYLKTNEKL